jgi:aa3 type cytochrome c oxidase subunit IV
MVIANDSELRAHQQMWQNFIRLIGYSAFAIAVLLALMAIFLL